MGGALPKYEVYWYYSIDDEGVGGALPKYEVQNNEMIIQLSAQSTKELGKFEFSKF